MSANRRMMVDKNSGCEYFKTDKGNVEGRNGSGISCQKKYSSMQQTKSKKINLEAQSNAVYQNH